MTRRETDAQRERRWRRERARRDRLLRVRPIARRSRYRLFALDLSRRMREARAASRNGRREVCGLVLELNGALVLSPQRNHARRPGRFILDGILDRQEDARRLGLRLVGTYHSHIAYWAIPGDTDIAGAEDGDLMLILDTCDQEARLWRIRGGRAYQLRYQLIH